MAQNTSSYSHHPTTSYISMQISYMWLWLARLYIVRTVCITLATKALRSNPLMWFPYYRRYIFTHIKYTQARFLESAWTCWDFQIPERCRCSVSLLSSLWAVAWHCFYQAVVSKTMKLRYILCTTLSNHPSHYLRSLYVNKYVMLMLYIWYIVKFAIFGVEKHWQFPLAEYQSK